MLEFLFGLLVMGAVVLVTATLDPDLFNRSLSYAAIELAVAGAGVWFVGWYVLFRSGTRHIRDTDGNNSNKATEKDGR
jgi:hypothetical protein